MEMEADMEMDREMDMDGREMDLDGKMEVDLEMDGEVEVDGGMEVEVELGMEKGVGVDMDVDWETDMEMDGEVEMDGEMDIKEIIKEVIMKAKYSYSAHEINTMLIPAIHSEYPELCICFESDNSYWVSLLGTAGLCPQETVENLKKIICNTIQNKYEYGKIYMYYDDNTVTVQLVGLYHNDTRERELVDLDKTKYDPLIDNDSECCLLTGKHRK